MAKTVMVILNVITGVFVVTSSILGFLISGIAETDGITNDFKYLVWLLVWIVGVALQFKTNARLIGLIITLIPVAYYFLHYF